ncbi:MAG: twin-arginine translocase TatA/TatE family subunit [Desulfobaccales bacterium]
MGIDFDTLILLAVLAFILFGPQKLPEYAAKLGALIAKLREASSDLTRQYQTSFPDLIPPPPPPGVNQQADWQQQPAPPTFHCPKCSRELGPDFVYCPQCGHHLKEEGEASAPAPEPPPPPQTPAS